MSETPPTARELLGNLYAATESARAEVRLAIGGK